MASEKQDALPGTDMLPDRDGYAFDEDATIGAFPVQPTAPSGSARRAERPSLGAMAQRTDLMLPSRYGSSTLLDEGGMGHVLLAEDRAMKRDVAVKRLRTEYAAREDLRLRFLREADIQAHLEHPGVVPIYDVGHAQDGAPFFAMKRLQGTTLHHIISELATGDVLASARFSLRRRLEVFESVCQTMLFAHHRGIVHRDLKPANVMLGEFGEVYVLDWGIAKVMSHPSSEVTQTQAGEQMGTPGYMAPEQAVGSLDVDERADVYSLGMVLFELLTLEPMFAGGGDEKVAAAIGDEHVSPRERAPLREIPAALDALCRRAVAFDPTNRLQSVRELHAGVTRWLDGERSAQERVRLADGHVEKADELARTDPARALRELSSALAIDPEHRQATRRLVQLLSIPSEPSAEAEAALKERARENLVTSAGRTYLAYAGYLPCLAFLVLSGVRTPWMWLTLLTFMALSAVAGVFLRKTASGPALFATTALGFGALAMVGTIAGPFSMASAIVVGNGAAYILAARPNIRQRFLLLGGSVASLAAPFLFHALGLAPAPYVFEGGNIVVQPLLSDFDPQWTSLLAMSSTLVCVMATYYLVGRAVDRLRDAERQTFLRAWRLERILPSAAAQADGANS